MNKSDKTLVQLNMIVEYLIINRCFQPKNTKNQGVLKIYTLVIFPFSSSRVAKYPSLNLFIFRKCWNTFTGTIFPPAPVAMYFNFTPHSRSI